MALFWRIPVEIRLDIYRILLADHYDKTLRIRIEAPSVYEKRRVQQRKRCKFRYIADRMRSRTAESTYCLEKSSSQDFHPAILGVSQQIHAEASGVLYSEHTFDFGMDVECIVPFFKDRSSVSLSTMKHIRLVKRSLPYTKDFDRCEWRTACTFLAEKMQRGDIHLKQIDLDVYGGTPSLADKPALYWKQHHTYSKSDFGTISKLEDMEEDMDWVKHIVAIKGLQVLNVRALLEHCPIPGSKKMAFFVNFSASIERGLADYLKSLMFAQSS